MLASGGGNGQDSELIVKIKAIQKNELEQRKAIDSFLAHFSNENSAASYPLFQSVIEDCSRAEEMNRNLWNENGKLNEKLANQEKEKRLLENRYKEEMKRQESVFAKAQHDFNLSNDNLRKQLGVCESEINAKNHTLRRLEDECSHLRIDAGQFESKLESLHSEMISLDSAMASLHGEISALQKELDEAEAAKKQLSSDLAASRLGEQAAGELAAALGQQEAEAGRAREELELQLAEAVAKLEAAVAGTDQRVQALTAERAALQASVTKKESALRQQGATNQELNELVSKMHSDLIREKQVNSKLVEDSRSAEEASRAELGRLRAALEGAEQAGAQSSRALLAAEERVASLQAKSGALQRDLDAQAADCKKQAKRVERLEQEKHELMREVAGEAKAAKEAQAALAAGQAAHSQTLLDVEEKDKLVQKARADLKAKDDEIRQQQNEINEKDNNALVMERQLNEEKKLKEVSQEAARAQQRDHAARVVEAGQKSARLASELSAAQSSADALKKQVIEASALISACEHEKEGMSKAQAATHAKLQTLEDKYEESAARLEASEAELEDVQQTLGAALQAVRQELADKQRLYQEELGSLAQSSRQEAAELREALAASKKQADAAMERALGRTRSSFQRQLEELQAAHHREVSDARSRVNTVAAAMESLQGELAAECGKSAELQSEVELLREQAVSSSSGAEESLSRLHKDRAKERSTFEHLTASLKNQLKSESKTSALLQQQLDAATQQLQIEKEEKKKTDKALREVEESLSRQVQTTEELEAELFALKRQASEGEKRASYQIQQKIDEIQRVARRNEVLSEAVTRLTQMNSSDRSHNISGSVKDNKYIFDHDHMAGDKQISSDFGSSASCHDPGGTGGGQARSARQGGGSGGDFHADPYHQPHHYDGHSGGNAFHPYGDANNSFYKVQSPSCAARGGGDGDESRRSGVSSQHHTADTGRSKQERSPENGGAMATTSHSSSSSSTLPPPQDVNSSMLRVQQALDSRRKLQQSPGSGSVQRASGQAHQPAATSCAGRAKSQTPEASSSKTTKGVSVPKLDFNVEFENEIREDSTPRSGSGGREGGGGTGGLFAVRIRDEVELGKDSLLPFSPKRSATKLVNKNSSSPGGCRTERDDKNSKLKSAERRALSAPADRTVLRE